MREGKSESILQREIQRAERVQERLGELVKRLLDTGGSRMEEHLRYDEDLSWLLEKGRWIPVDGLWVRPGAVGKCHRNAVRKQKACSQEWGGKVRIATGYALTGGIWYCHSWLMPGERQIIETTPIERKHYFGAVMARERERTFRRENG